jgi:lambda family phage portal protein
VRSYNAAKIGRLTNDWTTSTTSANKEVRNDIKVLRARSRQLERDNDYVRRFFGLLSNNVLGSSGIGFQAKSRDLNGALDAVANRKIEQAWAAWGTTENCTVAGTHSFLDVQRLVLRSVARDGAVIIRKVRNWDNPFHFAIQVLENDHLDSDYNNKLQNGNLVRMGVERDKWERPIAYWILNGHEGDEWGMDRPTKRERVPADQILLITQTERPHQVVGVPWLSSSMMRLSMLHGYMEAEVTAARIGAAKMGFFTKAETGEGFQGEEEEATGHLISDVAPGQLEELPVGVDFKAFDPTHPNSQFGEFVKSCLRSISAGLGVSYNSLANDLDGVSYSSIRAGLLEEREEWKATQGWFIQHVMEPIYREWLTYALLSDALQLPATKEIKFRTVEWKPRRWAWVDPLKDTQANILNIENGLKSRRAIVSEAGGDFEKTIEEIAQDKEFTDSKGVEIGNKAELSAEGDDE